MNFEDFLAEDITSVMQQAHAEHQKHIDQINASTDGAERADKLKAAKDAYERRKEQIRRNLGSK